MALCQAPFMLEDPRVGVLFPPDAIAKAKHYLSLNSGGVGELHQTANFLSCRIAFHLITLLGMSCNSYEFWLHLTRWSLEVDAYLVR